MPTRRKVLYRCLKCGYEKIRYVAEFDTLCPDCGTVLKFELIYLAHTKRKVVVK
jgi:predicted RNA-binding Zn-ribbon protein involved in translation (DUF1610 family)